MDKSRFEVDVVSRLESRGSFCMCIFIADMAKMEGCVPRPLVTSLGFWSGLAYCTGF